MAFDPLDLAALAPMVDAITASINGAVDQLGAATITIGPIIIPAFTIKVTTPNTAVDPPTT